MSNWLAKTLPYAFLLFTVGFGWFGLAPLVPSLMHLFNVSEAAVLVILSSAYGGAFIVVGLLSGWLSAKVSLKGTIYLAAVLSLVGLAIRVISPDYVIFLVASVIAALAYPIAMAPIGAVAVSIDKTKKQAVTGISLGGFFVGMAAGSLLNPFILKAVGLTNTFLVTAILSLIALIIILLGISSYPSKYSQRSLRGVFKPGMVKNWYVGFVVPALTVMFGGIAVGMLEFHKFGALSIYYGGLFGSLAFIGSALGTIILPGLFEKYGKVKVGYIGISFLAFAAMLSMAYFVAYTADIAVLAASFFLFGLFADTYWSMSLEGVTNYVDNPAQAGFATSLMQVAGNFGVFIIPALVGPLFSENAGHYAAVAVAISSVLLLIGFILSFFLKTEPEMPEVKDNGKKPTTAKTGK